MSSETTQAMSVLPESLFGTYLKYKDGNESVARWLVETAQSYGYRLRSSPNVTQAATGPQKDSKLKGRARTLARKAKKVSGTDRTIPSGVGPRSVALTVSSADYVSMALHITSQPKPGVTVPAALIRVLDRLINARKRCNSWFERNSNDEIGTRNNSSHSHFIQILETTLGILVPYSSDILATPSTPARDTPASANHNFGNFANRFEHLSVEETTDESFEQPKTPYTEHPNESSGEVQPKIKLQEPHDREHLLFACFHVLQDLNDIRKYLKDLWLRYDNGDVPLVTASLITNAALDLARRIEEELWKQFPDQKGYERTIIQLYFETACAARQSKPREDLDMGGKCIPQQQEVIELSEWCFRPTWYMLQDIVYHGGEWVKSLVERYTKSTFANASTYEASCCSDAKLLHKLSIGVSKDQFVKGLRHLVTSGGELPLWLPFAARVQLDIRRLITKQDYIHELRQTAVRVRWAAAAHTRFLRRLGSLPVVDDVESSFISTFIALADKILNGTNGWKLTPGCNPTNANGVLATYANSPLMVGLLVFGLLMTVQQIGLAHTDGMNAVLLSAHLYNAIRRESKVDIAWPDMEHLIQVHGARHIFVGDPPNVRAKYWRHYALAVGVSIANFAKDVRCAHRGRQGDRRLFTPGHSFLCRSLGKHTLQGVQLDLGLDELLLLTRVITRPGLPSSMIHQDIQGDLLNKPELWKKVGEETSRPSPTENLASLEGCLLDEMPALHFDYFGMHERCWELLSMTNEDLKKGGMMRPEELQDLDVSNLPSLVLLHLDTATTLRFYKETHAFTFETLPVDKMVQICAKRMASFLARHGSVGIGHIRSVLPSYMLCDKVDTSARLFPATTNSSDVGRSVGLAMGPDLPQVDDSWMGRKETGRRIPSNKVAYLSPTVESASDSENSVGKKDPEEAS